MSASRLVFARLVTDTAKRSSYLNKKNTLKIRQNVTNNVLRGIFGLLDLLYSVLLHKKDPPRQVAHLKWSGIGSVIFWFLSGVEEIIMINGIEVV